VCEITGFALPLPLLAAAGISFRIYNLSEVVVREVEYMQCKK